MNIPDYLASGEAARLIPVAADSSKEARAASILLATLTAVPPFRSVMLGSLGQRVGARTNLDCFTEITLKKDTGKSRPDGLIHLEGGRSRVWTCFVEAKIKNATIEKEQVERYMELARANNISAVLTISNEFVASPSHSPIHLPKSALKNVEFFHWSWMFALTQAMLLLNDDQFDHPEQRYILAEMVRYFSHPSIGISTFDRMNPEWKELVGKIQSGAALNKTDPDVENSVAAWHQEVRDLCLLMTRKLSLPVHIRLSKAHMDDPVQRLKDDSRQLVDSHKLHCAFEVPDAAAPIEVTADMLRRSLTVSMTLAAPKDKQKTSSRVNWLLRQLSKTNPDGIYIKAIWPGRAQDTQEKLDNLRNDASLLDANHKSLLPTSLEVMLVRDLAGKFSGSKTFIEQVEEIVPYFYQQVGQYLKPYVAPPPKFKEKETNTQENDNGSELQEVSGSAETASGEASDEIGNGLDSADVSNANDVK